jgi:hypothetical protein
VLGRRTSPAKSWDVKSPVFTPNNRDTHDAKTRYSSLHSQRKKSDVRSSLPRSLFLVPPPAAEGFSRHGSHRCCGKAGGGMRLQRTGSVGPTGVTSDSTDCRRARWRSSTVALRRVEFPFRGAKGDNQSAMGPVSLEQPRLFGDGVDNNSLSEWLRTALPSDPRCIPAPMAIRPAFRFALWTNFTASMILQRRAPVWLPCSASYRRHAMRCQN